MKLMFSPDLQAEFLDLELLEQIDICPEEVEEFEQKKEEDIQSTFGMQTPLPF